MTPSTILAGALLPESILHTHWFFVLANFVAVNTILYVSLSIFKIMPKLYRSDIVKSHRPRAETRSVYPNGRCPPDDYQPEPGSLAAKKMMRVAKQR
jgi:hypothetical protein